MTVHLIIKYVNNLYQAITKTIQVNNYAKLQKII